LEKYGFTGEESEKLSEEGAKKREELSILSINPNLLDGDSELRRLFGMKGGGERGQPVPNRRRRTQVRSTLVRVKEEWPRIEGGISMEEVEKKDGIGYFRCLWNETYKGIQDKFFACIDTGDPNTLAAVRAFSFFFFFSSKNEFFFYSCCGFIHTM